MARVVTRPVRTPDIVKEYMLVIEEQTEGLVSV